MNQRKYTATYVKDGKWLVAWVNEVPGAITQARTMTELKENIQDALGLMLDENQRRSGAGISKLTQKRFNVLLLRGHEAVKTD